MEVRSIGGIIGRKTAARYVSENTMKGYKRHSLSLGLFFENIALDKITIAHIRDYQEARVEGEAPFIRRRRPQERARAVPL